MRRSISAFITTLLLSTAMFPAAVHAEDTRPMQTSLNPYVEHQSLINQMSPFNLAYLAYQGYLKDQGIPSSGELIDALASGTVTAQDVIQAGIKSNRLPEQILNDRGYRSALEGLLQGFTTN